MAAPRAVRYAWANDPKATLYNAADLPAARAGEGSTFEIEIRGRRVPATVVKMPFYKDASHK